MTLCNDPDYDQPSFLKTGTSGLEATVRGDWGRWRCQGKKKNMSSHGMREMAGRPNPAWGLWIANDRDSLLLASRREKRKICTVSRIVIPNRLEPVSPYILKN
jgi:hypothetical protein